MIISTQNSWKEFCASFSDLRTVAYKGLLLISYLQDILEEAPFLDSFFGWAKNE